MTSIHYDEDQEKAGVGRNAMVRLVLAVFAVALAVVVLVGGQLGLGDLSVLDPAWLFEWRIGLLFLAGTAAIVVLQAFFTQYFDVKLRKATLLEELRRDQADDLAVLDALAKNEERNAALEANEGHSDELEPLFSDS